MKCISTTGRSAAVSGRQAVERCVAPDGGMYLPERLPLIPSAFFKNVEEMNIREIAYVVATSLFGDEVPAQVLKKIVDESFAFDAPLVHIKDNVYVLELFHGPTLTFKDYGARFMGRLLGYFQKESGNAPRHVLVASTGNTGAAAANGLHGIPGITVSVLYPKGRLKRSQIAQFTALGDNVFPLEVLGSVEDCKRLVLAAINDPELGTVGLTGANSLNIARIVPQITFAIHAYAQLRRLGLKNAHQAVYSIPCGNAGNIAASLMALQMGLPAHSIIAATNANNQVSRRMKHGTADGSAPEITLAPSMDMSTPSGWPRVERLMAQYPAMAQRLSVAASVDDALIASTIRSLRSDSGYTIDPHGAVAYAAAQNAALLPGQPVVVFATGHPAKQLDTMTQLTGASIELPVQLTRFMSVRRNSIIIPPTLPALRKHIKTQF